MSTERWEIDSSKSAIHFSVRHFLISRVHGRFSRWSGSILLQDGDWSRATVEVVIDASSMETGIPKRDRHLRSTDYLDAEHYPEITFRSRLVKTAATGRRLTGELTLKGRTREVILDVEELGLQRDPWGNQRAGFLGRGRLGRREFGLTGTLALDSGGLLIGERIAVDLEVEAVRQAAASVA